MERLIIILLLFIPNFLLGQIKLTIEGVDTVLTTYSGYNIPRTSPTNLVFRNNNLYKNFLGGYVLQCGDDGPGWTGENNLDGAVIKGNNLNSITGGGIHGMMLGYNINYDVRYNRISNSTYGMVIEGDTNDVYTSGGIAYNIIKSNEYFPILLFGPDSVRIYNNTIYSDRDASTLGLISVTNNNQHGYTIETKGTEIKNNIFYAVNDVVMIRVDSTTINSLECDYNVYYSESGSPVFRNNTTGAHYTFSEWQALGFDTHSVVIDPEFVDTIGFTPSKVLNYGTNLGLDFEYGLAPTAEWIVGEYPDTIKQSTSWQVGAKIYETANNPSPVYVSSVIENTTPSILEMTFSLPLSNIVPATSAFNVIVNSETRNISSVSISGSKVLLTLASPIFIGDVVTVAYTKPVTNPIQTTSGGQLSSLTAQSVINNVIISQENPKPNEYPDSIYLSPNPNDGRFSIKLESSLSDKKKKIKIVNRLGGIVYSGILAEFENIKEFNLSELIPGAYIIMVSVNNTIITTITFIKN